MLDCATIKAGRTPHERIHRVGTTVGETGIVEHRMTTLEELQSREESNPKIVQRSRMEGAVIRDFARKANLTTYIDFGCWVGLLAQQALHGNDFERAVLVDAVGSCLRKTSARIDAGVKAEYHQVAIVADTETRAFRVPGHDTSCAGFGQDGMPISVSQVEVCSFLRSLQVDLARTYLKIDLEGLDLKVASRMQQADLLPRVLHVEFAGQAEFDFLHFLLKGSYAFPEKMHRHAFYSMALSRERGVLIGFDPDLAYL